MNSSVQHCFDCQQAPSCVLSPSRQSESVKPNLQAKLELFAKFLDIHAVSKVEKIESDLQKLSLQELEEVRDWIESFLEDQLQVTDEFKASIERGQRDIAEERVRVRKPGAA